MPILDSMKDFVEPTELKRLLNEGKIEICPLGYMRGRTFKNSFIILDEGQNTTPRQMKMLLTRIGQDSKMVINGDLHQSDIHNDVNGLQDFILRLKSKYKDEPHEMYKDGFGMVELLKENTYRNPIIKTVMQIYDN